jgi:hypothetical protein
MILIYPPVAKPSEPPAGIARLAGSLQKHGVRHRLLDANIEGLLFLAASSGVLNQGPYDTWARRALRNLPVNLKSLKDRGLYRSFDRYKRAVMDVNKGIEMSGINSGITIGLANYQHNRLSPLRSADLIRAAESPEENPFFPYFRQRLISLFEEEQPSMAGFSLNYLSQALCAFAMAGFLKQICPEIKLVFGGGLVTSWIRGSDFKNRFEGFIDHLVPGPGEGQLLSILGINGIRKDVYTPDYSSLPLDDYLSPGTVLPYSASTGCHWNRCSFCPEKAEGNQYVPVPAERVKDDLNSLVAGHNPVLIHLLDNSIRPELLTALAADPPGVPWYGFTRISNMLADPDFCVSLKRCGCVMLKLGLESGDQSLLDHLHKGIDLETASAVLKALKKAGIATYVYLLFGTPTETPEGARKTLEYTVRHSDEIGFLNLAIFNMPLSWNDSAHVKTRSFYEGDLSLYTDFSHPAGWDRKEVRIFLENEFRKNKAVSSILKKDPPFFTSNHAPFFVM